jgi:hypothetical protein
LDVSKVKKKKRKKEKENPVCCSAEHKVSTQRETSSSPLKEALLTLTERIRIVILS